MSVSGRKRKAEDEEAGPEDVKRLRLQPDLVQQIVAPIRIIPRYSIFTNMVRNLDVTQFASGSPEFEHIFDTNVIQISPASLENMDLLTAELLCDVHGKREIVLGPPEETVSRTLLKNVLQTGTGALSQVSVLPLSVWVITHFELNPFTVGPGIVAGIAIGSAIIARTGKYIEGKILTRFEDPKPDDRYAFCLELYMGMCRAEGITPPKTKKLADLRAAYVKGVLRKTEGRVNLGTYANTIWTLFKEDIPTLETPFSENLAIRFINVWVNFPKSAFGIAPFYVISHIIAGQYEKTENVESFFVACLTQMMTERRRPNVRQALLNAMVSFYLYLYTERSAWGPIVALLQQVWNTENKPFLKEVWEALTEDLVRELDMFCQQHTELCYQRV